MKFLLNIILLHLSFASALAAVDPLAEWTLLSPIPTMDDLSGVVFGKGMYVAGGGVGTFLSSADGENWTMHKLPNTNAIKYTLGAITFGADQFVGVGPAGAILTSPDGLTWTPQWSGVDELLRSVCYGNDRFVAVGGGSQRAILTSFDGTHWKVARLSEEGTLWQVAFGNDRFVAVGNFGAILNSFDGARWTSRTLLRGRLSSVAFGKGRFVAAGDDGVLLISTDGFTWSASASPIQGVFPQVTFGDRKFVMMGDRKVANSPDGLTWTVSQAYDIGISLAIAYTGDKFVAVGSHGFIGTSTHGQAWTSHSYGPDGLFEDVARGKGEILIKSGSELIGSNDGVTWTKRGGSDLSAIALSYANSNFVVFARDIQSRVQAQSSPNGLTWTPSGVNSSDAALRIIYGGGQYVGVGGGIFTLPDAMHWTVRRYTNLNSLTGVAYGNGRYLAVGRQSTTYTSSDAVAWQEHFTGTDWLGDVTFGNGKFVAIGSTFVSSGNVTYLPEHGAIFSSWDGEHWVREASSAFDATQVELASVDYGGGWFVAVGSPGVILTSQDGAHWEMRDSKTYASLSSVRYSDGNFLVVGGRGTLLMSGNLLLSSLIEPTMRADGFTFRILGANPERARIQVTSDLRSGWTDLEPTPSISNAELFLDQSSVGAARRFYRVHGTK